MTTRKIYVVGEINQEAYLKFSKRLSLLERQGDTSVEVELFSEGGDVYAALAFSARMAASPLHIIVRGVGYVASAAVLILASGDWRTLSPESWVMTHEDNMTDLSGTTTSFKHDIKQLERHEAQWVTLLEGKTKAKADRWAELHQPWDTYITALECLSLGLIDEIA